MNDTLTIKCGHCQSRHNTVGEVKDCANGTLRPIDKLCMNLDPHPEHYSNDRKFRCKGIDSAAVASKVLASGIHGFATQRQLDYINDLGGDPRLFVHKTVAAASHEISRLRKNPPSKKLENTVVEPNQAPNRVKTIIPLEMLTALKDGYYATRQDETHTFTFFRVSRPKSGHYKGSIKIQTQHGPEYKMMMEIWGEERIYVHNKAAEDDLLLVAVDPTEANLNYAKEIGRCMRCNTELTDERSRYYGIGPECEKHWPHIISVVDDTRGAFKFGSS